MGMGLRRRDNKQNKSKRMLDGPKWYREKQSREEGDGLQSRERSIFNKIVSQSLLERDGKEAAWLEGIQ